MSDQQQKQQGPGLLQRAGQAWQGMTARGSGQASQDASAALAKHHATVADGIKTAFAVFVGGFCPFLIALILTISAGYYFNALRGFTGDVQSIVAFGTAAIVELVNLALFFVSAKAFWSGKRAHFMTALIAGLLLTIISVIAQVLYLSNNLDMSSLKTGAGILSNFPVIGALASTALIIVTRAGALHLAEFCCCYVIARSSVSHRKIIQAQQEEQEAELAMLESQQYAEFRRALHLAQMAQLQRMQQTLLAEQTGAPAMLPFPGQGDAASVNGNGKNGKR